MNISSLIKHLAYQEQLLAEKTVLAPWVQGGRIRVRIEGLVHTLHPMPNTKPGWSYFRLLNEKQVVRLATATQADRSSYLQKCFAQPLHLALRLKQQTWLAVPQDMQITQRIVGRQGTVLVHLVERGQRFDTIRGCFDGASWWYDAPDRRTDPRLAAQLREAQHNHMGAQTVQVRGLTPALRMAYSVVQQHHTKTHVRRDAQRLRHALEIAGGTLANQQDRGDHWLVTWNTPDGERHTSAISKNQLTVLSAGICLSEHDRDFDLQSLVSVVQRRPEWMRA